MTTHSEKSSKSHFFDLLWDLWCLVSIIGIWPRFIEPNLLKKTSLNLPINDLPRDLNGLKIAQFSDLHLHKRTPDRFLNKIVKKIEQERPDIIVFTGDFLCFSQMKETKRLKRFLNRFKAPLGCYAIFGNHDYQSSVSLNEEGYYDLVDKKTSMIGQGFKRLFSPVTPRKIVTERARNVPPHNQLIQLLKETPFQLLDNATQQLSIKDSFLNLTGVGEYILGRCLPEKAFKDYQEDYPGIVLAHNPDCLPYIESFPGDLIVSGHTHGAQINLPFLWKKLILIENEKYKRGLFRVQNKWFYVNRGVGSVMPFRWFSPPEITFFTLKDDSSHA